jgi:uncharacterized DUF497 family protein
VFEFDPAKSTANQEKHGIDFTEAQKLWNNPVIATPLDFPDEARFLVVGRISTRFYSAIITYRHEKIRIIPVRCSRKAEIQSWLDNQS